jgi:hypothetical protein
MQKALLYVTATLFYLTLAVYLASELYYNHTYWRLVLRRKRRHRWEYLLWMERAILIALGVTVIAMTFLKF